jgi:sugar lactone lactonase YvrE
MNRHNSSIEIVAGGLHMPECPRWHDEHLWFSDIRGATVHRVDDGHVSVVHRFPDGEEAAGLGWLPNGNLLVAGMAKRVIYRLSGECARRVCRRETSCTGLISSTSGE